MGKDFWEGLAKGERAEKPKQERKGNLRAEIIKSNKDFDVSMNKKGFEAARKEHFAELRRLAKAYGKSDEHVFAIAEHEEA